MLGRLFRSARANSAAQQGQTHRSHSRWFLATLLCSALLSLPVAPTLATSMRELTLKELVAQADLIALGRVYTQQARFRDDRSAIVTDVEFQPEQVLKGIAQVNNSLVITHLGGEVDGIGLQIPGEVSFQAGESTLLFLKRSSTDPTQLRVVGMSQGKYHVEGTEVYSNSGHGWANADGTTNDALVEQGNDNSESQSLADFIAEIQSLVTELAR